MQIIQRPSPNRSVGRQGRTPDIIVLHTTGGTTSSGINTVLNPGSQVSYHFIIGRGGEITQHVNIEDMAWANGTTNSGDNRDNRHSTIAAVQERRINANLYTVSIGFGDMPSGNPSPGQLSAVVWLIKHIRSEVEQIYGYSIPMTKDRIIGHNEVTPITRPNCPGQVFPFDEIIRHINEADVPSAPPSNPGDSEVPAWGVASWEWAIENGITDGTRPNDAATRLEAVALLHRAKGIEVNKECGQIISPALSEAINPQPADLPTSPQSVQPPPPANRKPLVVTEFELDALCKMVWAESRGEDGLGQRLVVHVVLNRIASPNFPDNLLEVLFQRNAFSPVHNGAFNRATPDEKIRQNVLTALSEPDHAHNATFFRSVQGAEGSWHETNLTRLFVRGGHIFYM